MGLYDAGNKKACKGTLTHKALELIAKKKVAIQEGSDVIYDAETGKDWRLDELTFNEAIDTAWDYYTKKETHFDWKPVDFRDCKKWMLMALDYNNGLFNPLNRTVIWPEKYFDFTIDKPWAHYSYELPDGRKLDGQLSMKGTIDLVCKMDDDPDTIELIDWKTGQRKDWNTGLPKDYKSLRKDSQLRIYHYALSHIYPQAKNIVITIVYVRDGGPFSLPFCKDDLAETEDMLQKRFETIRDCERPKRIWGDWKCTRLCHFGKNTYVDKSGVDTGELICSHIHKKVIELGVSKCYEQFKSKDEAVDYGSGGGRSKDEHK